MPSTLVHVALGGLLAAGLLGAAFDLRALGVVTAATALPDLDSFATVLFTGAHRALLHTYLLPLALVVLLVADTLLRERSWLRGRVGGDGVRVAWVAVAALSVAGIGLDFVTNGVNALYPVVDQFYVLDGKVELSTEKGLVQTFVETPDPPATGGETGGANASGGGGVPAPESVGTTENVTYTTGVNPEVKGGIETGPVERVFPVVRSGWQLLVVVAAGVVLPARLAGDR